MRTALCSVFDGKDHDPNPKHDVYIQAAAQQLRLALLATTAQLANQGLGIKTNEAGRAATYDLLKAELLIRDSSTGEITAGPKLLT